MTTTQTLGSPTSATQSLPGLSPSDAAYGSTPGGGFDSALEAIRQQQVSAVELHASPLAAPGSGRQPIDAWHDHNQPPTRIEQATASATRTMPARDGGTWHDHDQPPGRIELPAGKFAGTGHAPGSRSMTTDSTPDAPRNSTGPAKGSQSQADAGQPTASDKTSTDAANSASSTGVNLAEALLALILPATSGVPGASAAGNATDKSAAIGSDKSSAGGLAQALSALTGDVASAVASGSAAAAQADQLPDSRALIAAALEAGAGGGKDGGKSGATGLNPTAALLAAPSHGPQALPLQLQMQSSVGSQGFGQELGQQIAWLGGQDVKQASIRLHPQDLGQLDVKISVSQGRVDVVFNAQHPAAVTAVQQTLPHLGNLLSHHGLSLGHAEVSQQGRGDQRQAQTDGSPSSATGSADEIQPVHLTQSVGSISLLDAFA